MKKVPPVNYGVYTYETINAIMNVIPDVYSGKISVDAALKEAEEQAKSEINR